MREWTLQTEIHTQNTFLGKQILIQQLLAHNVYIMASVWGPSGFSLSPQHYLFIIHTKCFGGAAAVAARTWGKYLMANLYIWACARKNKQQILLVNCEGDITG